MPSFSLQHIINESNNRSEDNMGLILKKKRIVTITHEDKEEDIFFSITCSFRFAEDADYTKHRQILNSKEDIEENLDNEAQQMLYFNLRKSIIDCSDITDEDGKPIKIIEEGEKVNEFNQKLVFEACKNIPEVFKKMLEAHRGFTSKNSKTGPTEQSTGDGQ